MAYDDYRLLRVTVDGAICRATIDNPPINLLDVPLIAEIDRLTREVAADETLHVLVVDSADPEFFIAHADVGLIRDLPADVQRRDGKVPGPAAGHDRRHRGHRARRWL
jgi:enoyl-CoA hydratase/carnithine racemase